MKPAVLAQSWLLAAVAFTTGAPAKADPMRPLVATPSSAPAVAAAPTIETTGTANPAAPHAPVVRQLQAIRQNSSGERTALFGDRWLRVGDQYTSPDGDTVVRAIGAHHVELAQGKLTYTHHLLAPLLPPQWPVRTPARPGTKTLEPAALPSGNAVAPRPTSQPQTAATGSATNPAPTAAPPSAPAKRPESQ